MSSAMQPNDAAMRPRQHAQPVHSWPFGLAISLLMLPPIATAYGTSAVYLVVVGLIAGGMVGSHCSTDHQTPSNRTLGNKRD
jgi:hypothetical protein